jgi:hypothetical protein
MTDGDGKSIFTPQPIVAFNSETLIVAAIGERGNGCCAVSIESVVETPSNLLVSVMESIAGQGCAITQAATRPMTLAFIPKTSKQVDFRIKQESRKC